MPPIPLPKPRYLRYALLTLALAVTVLLLLPYLLHTFDKSAGGFGTDTLNTLALAATLFWGGAATRVSGLLGAVSPLQRLPGRMPGGSRQALRERDR